MAYLEIRNINKHFGNKHVLKDICITAEKGSFVSLLGESGSGKTTLLRIIAGLEKPESGNVFLDGKDITYLPVEKRGIGLVFQNYALFPHMNVYNNIAYALKLRKIPAHDIHKRVVQVLEKVYLHGKENQSVASLSGGEQQRVAIARAVVAQPKVLLLDEPLSNLDYHLRIQARNELKRLQNEIGVTSVFVTHDQSEALSLSNEIAVLNNSVIMQVGNPQDVYLFPDNVFTARFVGRYNIFNSKEAELLLGRNISSDLVLAVLPEHLRLEKKAGNQHNAVIKDILFTGSLTEYLLIAEDKEFKSVSMTNGDAHFLPHDKVFLSVETDKCKTLPA